MLQNTFGFLYEAERPSPDPQALGGQSRRPSKSSFLSQALVAWAAAIARGTEASAPCGAIRPCCSPGPSPLQVALHCPCGTSFHSGGWTLPCFPTQPSHPHFSAFSQVSPLLPACSLKLKAMGQSRHPLGELRHQRATLRGTFLSLHIQSYLSKQHFAEVFSSCHYQESLPYL